MKTMTSLQTLLCLTILLLDSGVLVKSIDSKSSVAANKVKNTFLTVTVGEDVTLKCFYKNELRTTLYWYKQSLEYTQSLVSSYFYKTEFDQFYNKTRRFTLDNKDSKNDLSITNVQMSDSAVYHCISCVAHQIQFLETITVIVKDLNSGLWLHQTASETIQPGRSVTLNCSVHTGTCDGPHRVYWFKQSEESAAGVLYSQGGSSDQCGRNTDSQTNSCVYNLPIHNVSSEQTGTYYCAVVSCGQVLFGNGTRINIANSVDSVVYILSGALAFTTILVVFLAFSLCTIKKKYRWQSTAPMCEDNMPISTTENQQDNLHYAALSINHASRRQRNTPQTDCVYSTVQQLN